MRSTPIKRVIVFIRRSSDEQEMSIERQRTMTSHYADRNGYEIVDTIILEDHSASLGQQLPALHNLIRRKLERNDFDAVLFADFKRFVRNLDDGQVLTSEFRRAGIRIVTVNSGPYQGKWSVVMEVVEALKGQEEIETWTINNQSGYTEKVQRGYLPPTVLPIYGLDKLYCDPDGTPLFILRDFPDKQVRLNPTGSHEVEVIPKRKHCRTFVKVRSHRVRFIPGARDRVNIVRWIFYWFFIEGKTPNYIAKRLNLQSIPSPRGGLWRPPTVRVILMNTAYTGTITANRQRMGCILERCVGSPNVFDPPKRPKVGHKQIIAEFKPRSQWWTMVEPALADFLKPKVRKMAIEWQDTRWRWRTEGRPEDAKNASGRERGGDRHNPARFPLTGLLRTKDGRSMNGATSREGARGYRSVFVAGVSRIGSIGANSVEREVCGCLADVLSAWKKLEPEIEAEVERRRKAADHDRPQLPKLLDEKREIEEEIKMENGFGAEVRALRLKRLKVLEARLEDVDQRIKVASPSSAAAQKPDREIVKHIREQVAVVCQLVGQEEVKSLRRIVKGFVSRLEFDPPTGILEVDIRLPEEAFYADRDLGKECGLVEIGSHPHVGVTSTTNCQGRTARFLKRLEKSMFSIAFQPMWLHGERWEDRGRAKRSPSSPSKVRARLNPSCSAYVMHVGWRRSCWRSRVTSAMTRRKPRVGCSAICIKCKVSYDEDHRATRFRQRASQEAAMPILQTPLRAG